MVISSPVFEAFLECRTKCWLRSCAEPNAGNAYADWARAQNNAYYEAGRRSLVRDASGERPRDCTCHFQDPKDATWRLAVDVHLRTNDLETHLQAVERIPSEGRGGPVKFVPYRFEFANKLTKNNKLLLAFDALVSPKWLDAR